MTFRPAVLRAVAGCIATAVLVAVPIAHAEAQRDTTRAVGSVVERDASVTRVTKSATPDSVVAPTLGARRGHGAAVFYGLVGIGTLAAFELRVDPDEGGYHDGWQTKAPFPDKVVHALASFALTGVGVDLGARPWLAASTVCAAGAAFEYSQGYVSYMDISANCVGAAGAALWKSWTKRGDPATRPTRAPSGIARAPVAAVVAVSEAIGDVHPGDTVRIAAIGRDADGRTIFGAPLRYAIASRGEVALPARIDRGGRFVADSAGLYLVLVESNGSAARVPVLVKPRPIVATRVREEDLGSARSIARLETVSVTAAPTSRIDLSSPDYEPYVGTTVRLDARIWTEGSDDPDTTAVPEWETSNSAIALVDHKGGVMFLRPGFVTISATHGGKTTGRRMQIWPSPAVRVVLRSDAHYPRTGDVVKLIDYAWQPGGMPVHHARANLAIVTADGAHTAEASISEDKRFVARVPGTYTVLSELNGLVSSVTFTVHPVGPRCALGLRRWDPSCTQ